MARVKRSYKARKRRKKILKLAKGMRGARSRSYRIAILAVHKAWQYAYRHRKERKRDFRKLWIIRINAAARKYGTSYSKLMGTLAQKKVQLNRKILAELAVYEPEIFEEITKIGSTNFN
jgi:large subunit ribosomal protein L20